VPGEPDEEAPEFDSAEEFEGIDVDIMEDGTVRLHAACQPGEDPERCRERIQGLVEALGLPLDAVVTDVGEQADEQAGATGDDSPDPKP